MAFVELLLGALVIHTALSFLMLDTFGFSPTLGEINL